MLPYLFTIAYKNVLLQFAVIMSNIPPTAMYKEGFIIRFADIYNYYYFYYYWMCLLYLLFGESRGLMVRAQVFNPVPGDPLSWRVSLQPYSNTPEAANQAPQDCLKIAGRCAEAG